MKINYLVSNFFRCYSHNNNTNTTELHQNNNLFSYSTKADVVLNEYFFNVEKKKLQKDFIVMENNNQPNR